MDAAQAGFKGSHVSATAANSLNDFGVVRMSTQNSNLTGVWHGLYSYDLAMAPVYFVATIMSGPGWISGTSHEAANEIEGQALTLFAAIEGSFTGSAITFIKTYDGSGGWSHSVPYSGHVSPDGLEIEGTWEIKEAGYMTTTGRFLMIRSPGASEVVVRQVYETV
jgi:hypothetical protein